MAYTYLLGTPANYGPVVCINFSLCHSHLKGAILLHTFSLVNHCMCIHSNLSRIFRVSKNTFFCAFVESLRQFGGHQCRFL